MKNYNPDTRKFVADFDLIDPYAKAEGYSKTYPSRGRLKPDCRPPAQRSHLYASGRIDLQGRGAIGYLALPSISKADREEERLREEYAQVTACRWHLDLGNVEITVAPDISRLITRPESQKLTEGQDTPPRKYGGKGLTGYGRRRVLQGGAILERRYGTRLGFYTLTLPSLTKERMALACSKWSELMNHYFTRLRQLASRRGMPKYNYVGVYEVQGKRFKVRHQFALHTHYLAPAYLSGGSNQFLFTADELRSIWADVLRSGLSLAPSDTLVTAAAVDSQLVRSSASGYLAKYLAKGMDSVDYFTECGLQDLFPSQWWTCSKGLRAAYAIWERRLQRDEIELLTYLCANAACYKELFDYCNPVHALIRGEEKLVGYAFKLSGTKIPIDLTYALRHIDASLQLLVG